MVRKKIVVANSRGIHARTAGVVSKAARQMSSEILILTDNQVINPKSILNLMAAAIHTGQEITIQCSGSSEEADLLIIEQVIQEAE